ncbi:hypothetical protein IC007_2326 [Sulfuracidifex tepidarius]|uniref:Uncharacterized protein n=2 Tax=Sulfuracidifex tepidarius TaxID=1294262 RepID=A0A510E5G7_9CREN|nr:hypothetical protein IC007_2326 [Sulfuracidifex tepidarius]
MKKLSFHSPVPFCYSFSMKQRAISGILGGLILITILVGSLSLLMTLEREQSSVFAGQQSSVSKTLEFSPLVEVYSQGEPLLMSSSGEPLYVKYLIFPDGEVKSVNVEISSKPLPVSSLVNNYNGWFIAVTNDGEEYNVSDYPLQDPSDASLNGGIGITHAISLKNFSDTQEVYNIIDEASSLPFHDVSGAEVVTQQADGTNYLGLSNVTLIYTFPKNNLTLCIGMYFFENGEPAPSPFGILFYSGDGYGNNYGHYYYEYFYGEGENNGTQLFWESFYPVVNSSYNQLKGEHSHVTFAKMYRYTEINDSINDGYLSVVFYRISIVNLYGTWYLSVGSKGVGMTYNESYPFQTSTYYPVGTQIPITSSPLYELYVFVPANATIVMQ